jgi:hypothetical protein
VKSTNWRARKDRLRITDPSLVRVHAVAEFLAAFWGTAAPMTPFAIQVAAVPTGVTQFVKTKPPASHACIPTWSFTTRTCRHASQHIACVDGHPVIVASTEIAFSKASQLA